MSEENIFIPDSELVEYVRSKGKWQKSKFLVKEVSGMMECDLCSRPVSSVVSFVLCSDLTGPEVHTCALGTCGVVLVGEEEWGRILFEMATLGVGLEVYKKVGYDKVVDSTRDKELVDKVYYWQKASKLMFSGIVVSILSFFSERGYISFKQRNILEEFVVECKKRYRR